MKISSRSWHARFYEWLDGGSPAGQSVCRYWGTVLGAPLVMAVFSPILLGVCITEWLEKTFPLRCPFGKVEFEERDK